MRLFSDLISVMIHRDPTVGANHWIGFRHFYNFNEAERSFQPYRSDTSPTLNPWEFVNPSRIAGFSMSEYPRLLQHMRQCAEDAIPDSSIRPELLTQKERVRIRHSCRRISIWT